MNATNNIKNADCDISFDWISFLYNFSAILTNLVRYFDRYVYNYFTARHNYLVGK